MALEPCSLAKASLMLLVGMQRDQAAGIGTGEGFHPGFSPARLPGGLTTLPFRAGTPQGPGQEFNVVLVGSLHVNV